MTALFIRNGFPSRFFQCAQLAFAMLLAGPSAAEEVTPENRALAEILFRDAKALADKEQYDQACPKFKESHRIDPKPGTVLNLAVCHEKQGQVATAWLDYLEAASFAARAGQKDRETFAREQAAKLDKSVPRLIVRVPETTPGIVVKLDATVISDATWGSAAPINPGAHTLEASAPGYKTWTNALKIENTPGNVEINVPKLEVDSASVPVDKPKDPPPDLGPKIDPKVPEKPIHPKTPPPPPSKAPVWIGVGLGAVGLAGMIYGTVNGARTFELREAGNVECGPSPEETYCTAKGLQLHADAAATASQSTGGFIVGGVGLGAGALLVILGLRATKTTTAPPSRAWVLPHVDRTGAGIWGGMAF